MQIRTTQTITDDEGRVYPFLAVTLATSPRWDASLGATVAIRLIPYRIDETGTPSAHPSRDMAFVTQDAVLQSQTDPALGAAVRSVADAIQAFVTAKGM